MEYILLVGVHGVGKTYLLDDLKKTLAIQALSISDLIKKAGENIEHGKKLVSNITLNQELWKQQLKKMKFIEDELVVLDGHMCLLNQKGLISELPFSTFDGLSIKKIILKYETPAIIQKRLSSRDSKVWDVSLISEFQQSEIRRAKLFSYEYRVPLFIYEDSSQIEELKKFILE